MPRIAVKYDQTPGQPNSGTTDIRWLDLTDFHLYDRDQGGTKVIGSKFTRTTDHCWETSRGTKVFSGVACVTPAPPAPDNERGAGLKFDSGKGQWTLLMQGFPKALAGVVEVLGFGAKKYAAHSWRKVEHAEVRYRDALYRHLNAVESGELLDPESGLSHWEHICFNALALNELSKGGCNAPV